MRVTDAYTSHLDPTQRARANANVGDKPAEPAAPVEGSGDAVKVSLSDRARELSAHETERETKVARLKEAVENGTFAIDATAIAARIVDTNGVR